MRKHGIALASFFAAALLAAQQQSGPAPMQMTLSDGRSLSMWFQGPPPPTSAIKGKPYSAVQVTEQIQILSDGSRFHLPVRKVQRYRDSVGRTRMDRPFNMGRRPDPPVVIDIRDPDAGYEYVLDSQAHVVHRVKLTVIPDQAKANRVKATAMSWASNGLTNTQEPLGAQMIEGVTAEGVRLTSVAAAGAFGNEAPMTTVQEHWFSPDIEEEVLRTESSPLHGETTMRLTNIVLAEPDPALFQIPADYQVVDETGPFYVKYAKPATAASQPGNKTAH